jgi:outer membrane autotransporter protein
MSWLKAFLAGTVVGIVALSGAAAAQNPDGPSPDPTAPSVDCSTLGDRRQASPSELAGCLGAPLNRQSLINTSTTIHDVVSGRLAPGNNDVAPAGLDLTPEEAFSRLAARGPISIVPAADAPAAAPSTLWNVWVEGKYSYLDNDDPLSNLDGDLWNVLAGIDYKLTDNFVLGIIGSFEASDLEGGGVLPATQDTEGFGGGVYMGLNLTENIVLSSSVLGSVIDTDTTLGAPASFESERVQASAALTGYWYSGTIRFSPMLSVEWSKEWQDDKAGILADQTFETAILTPGLQIGNTFAISDTSTMEPWLGAQLDWTFVNETRDDLLGKIVDDTSVDLRLQAGINFAFGTNAQLALTGEVSGILLDEQDTYSGAANLAFQF